MTSTSSVRKGKRNTFPQSGILPMQTFNAYKKVLYTFRFVDFRSGCWFVHEKYDKRSSGCSHIVGGRKIDAL
jgi:hypothetical protein